MAEDRVKEEKIFEAARKVFQRRGFSGARMQEIADEAGINKAMLHYYFRSKDKLFQKVFQAGVRSILPNLFNIISSEASLYEKTKQVAAYYTRTLQENPYLPMFVLHEMHQHPERFKEFMSSIRPIIPQNFIHQIQSAIERGEIRPISPQNFLINLLSWCMFPVIAENMISTVFGLNEEEFQDLIREREGMIPDLIFNGLLPRNGEKA